MNIELLQLYKTLSTTQQKNLRETFRNAPKMLLLLDVLPTPIFGNFNKTINAIYQKELSEGVARAVVINRFYKLREKAKHALLELARQNLTFLCEEEQELQFARLLLDSGQFNQAIRLLQDLEPRCWERNLFELLPAVYELQLRAGTYLLPTERIKMQSYLEKKQQASVLQQALSAILDYHFQIFLDIQQYHTILKKVAKIYKKHPFPRFELLYHYLALYYGVHWINQLESNALYKHFKAFNKLKKAYPNLNLLITESNNRMQVETKIAWQEIMYWHFRNDQARAEKLLKELVKQPNLIYIFKDEATLQNMVLTALQNDAYPESRLFIQLLRTLQESQHDTDTDSNIPYYCLELLAACRQYPNEQPPQPLEFVQTIAAKVLKNQFILGWAFRDLGHFCMYYGRYDWAENYLQHPKYLSTLEKNQLPMHSLRLLRAVQHADKQEIEHLCAILQKNMDAYPQRHLLEHFKEIHRLAQHLLDKLYALK